MTDPWNPSNVPPPTQPVQPVPPTAPPLGGPPPGAPQVPYPPGSDYPQQPGVTQAGPGVPGYGGPAGPAGGGPPPPGSGGSGRSPWPIVAITLGVVVLVVAVVLGVFLLGRRDNGDVSADGSTSTVGQTTVPTTAAPVTTPSTVSLPTVPPAPVTTVLGDVRNQPAGLLCRDLRAKGFSYSASVDYWRQQGQPDRLDVDKDGIPCETVYPTRDVLAYWGTQGVTPTLDTATVYDLPPGLLCRDLADRGFDVYEAIAYYLNWGGPANMDADGNGVPCESVYSNAYQAWTSGDSGG